MPKSLLPRAENGQRHRFLMSSARCGKSIPRGSRRRIARRCEKPLRDTFAVKFPSRRSIGPAQRSGKLRQLSSANISDDTDDN